MSAKFLTLAILFALPTYYFNYKLGHQFCDQFIPVLICQDFTFSVKQNVFLHFGTLEIISKLLFKCTPFALWLHRQMKKTTNNETELWERQHFYIPIHAHWARVIAFCLVKYIRYIEQDLEGRSGRKQWQPN